MPEKLVIQQDGLNENAQHFCDAFLHGNSPKYVLGRNEYAVSIAQAVNVAGFIDDFTNEKEFLGKPIIQSDTVPKDALVVSVVIGRPFVAEKSLQQNGIRFLNYFAFQRYSGLNVMPVKFWNTFRADFAENRDKYDWVYGLLSDQESKQVLTKIINFRLSQDLNFMRGFTDAQYRQYFEDFLGLESEGEIFADVGCFDGYTSLEFIKRCPNYEAIHVFEPEPGNMRVVSDKLSGHERIHYHPFGLSNGAQTLRFQSHGSSSRISDEGDIEIQVARLDDLLQGPFTFLKMDIEGGEMDALEGAQNAIKLYHPRLAISVYHRFDDLWKIPQRIFSYRNDYQIFLRHYTEGVDETVMFFMPKRESQ